MPRANPPRLSRDTDRHGNTRWYVRLPGRPKVRLKPEYGTEAFWADYRDALAGKALKVREAPAVAAAGSFRALCTAYFTSPEFGAWDVSTKSWRKRALELICKTKGGLPVELLDTKGVRALRNELSAQPAVANQRLKALRSLFAWAIEAEETKTDPTRDVKFLSYKKREHHSWTLEEVERYEKHWPLGTKPRLAMALLLYTAGRREDAPRLGPEHIKDGRIRFTQAKNEDRAPIDMDMPVHPDLVAAIAAGPPGGDTFLITQYGEPFTPNGFGNWFRDRCIEAGVPGRAHGLRKAIAARLAESQATAHEVMSVTGHKTLQEVERYTRAARKPQMADSAMSKLMANAIIVPPIPEVGHEEEKSHTNQAYLAPMALPWGIEPQFSP